MRKYFFPIIMGSATFVFIVLLTKVFAKQPPQAGYILEHEKDLAVQQPGPHDGGGNTTAFNFFSKTNDCKLVFRKRILHPGSAIGYHFQKEDEIYYIVSGTGEMKMNGEILSVKAGDAILTRPGSSHSLKQIGNEDLVIIINYEKR